MWKYNESDVARMVSLSKELGSMRKAAKVIGCSYQTVIDYCKKAGFHLPSSAEKSATNKSIVVDGIRFTWSTKGYYRGKTNHGRETLARYMYRKIHGTEMPMYYNIIFKDGNKDNYVLDNIEFKSLSECKQIYCKEHLEEQVAKLDKGRDNFIELCKEKPHFRRRAVARMWRTRRTNDPDNLFAAKGAETKRRNAEERGYFFTTEQKARMSEAHKGKTKESMKQHALGNEMAAIRRKMGMA